jgi:deoxyribonuclease V
MSSVSASMARWKQIQQELRARMIVTPLDPLPRFVAGADAAFSKDDDTVFAAAVVYDRDTRVIVDVAHATGRITAPYVPGFLTFREGDVVLRAIGNLKHAFGAICFDGQGIAHPRRCGIATHLGVTLDVPSVGVAKSRLVGTFDDPADKAGSTSTLSDKGEQIGLVLRTKERTRPVFVSVGHRIDLPSATELVLDCLTKYRIPEPTRQADIEVAKLKRATASKT